MNAATTTRSGDPTTSDAASAESGAPNQYVLSPDLVTLTEARPAEAEAVRTMRTHIIARHLKDGRRGLAVCAATPKVGCTFTAVNLAVSLAQVGTATLLIDGDLRDPQVERLIQPQAPVVNGLKQCVNADGRPSDYIHREVLPNLSVLYAGGPADNAQELLAGDAFRRVIDRCLRDYEFTIIDTAPANTCSDARQISTIIGYALIVARSQVSLVTELSALASQLHEDGARVVGTVLNEV